MKHLYQLLFISLLPCLSCTNSAKGNLANYNTRTDSPVTTKPTGVKQEVIRYRPLNFDTTVFEKNLSMYNKPYHLKISSYSLNDSGVTFKLKDSIVVVHNNAARIMLTQNGQTVIDRIVTKADFKTSASWISTLEDITYKSVRTNRLYFTCWLSSEWGKDEINFAIFYQGPHKGRLDYWGGLTVYY